MLAIGDNLDDRSCKIPRRSYTYEYFQLNRQIPTTALYCMAIFPDT